MKTTGTRSLILILLTLAFAGGMLFFLAEYANNGGDWAIQSFNKHITQGDSLSGRVLDRDGTVVAYSDETGRVYHDDKSVRLALLHVVGDTRGYIATSTQYLYRAELSGYNLITGLVSPFGETNGSDVKLTVDADVCRTAYEALSGKKVRSWYIITRRGRFCVRSVHPASIPVRRPTTLIRMKRGSMRAYI